MTPDWDRGEYEREKRRFIESRLLHRWVYFHAAGIFTLTWLAGWAASWALLKLGLRNMPLRYALGFALAYLVFMLCVRAWADTMRQERGSAGDPGASFDAPGADAEGCAVVMAAAVIGMAAAALFAMTGGLSLLLEVAFEVVFAGAVVRRVSRRTVVGDWAGVLWRNTWPHALAVMLALVAVAAWLQRKVPGALTFSEAVRALLP
jgi:hypothetical protein